VSRLTVQHADELANRALNSKALPKGHRVSGTRNAECQVRLPRHGDALNITLAASLASRPRKEPVSSDAG
jgi:hypothetical protein